MPKKRLLAVFAHPDDESCRRRFRRPGKPVPTLDWTTPGAARVVFLSLSLRDSSLVTGQWHWSSGLSGSVHSPLHQATRLQTRRAANR